VRSSKPAIAFAALLAPCGGSGEDPPAAGTGDGLVVDLRVAVRPEGSGGPKRVRRIKCESLGDGAIQPSCRALRALEPQDLDPVPGGGACAQIYGGPATARVAGNLRGMRVTASFDLTDSW
jgi:hypothetical protein